MNKKHPDLTHKIILEDLSISGFPTHGALFERILHEIRKPSQGFITYLNVHVANMAYRDPNLKQILQQADCLYCDGAGIIWGARLLGQHIPMRFPAADWFMDLLAFLAETNCTVYLLGGKPGVPECMMEKLNQSLPQHTVIGYHHGYFHQDKNKETQLIKTINRLKPDLLIVGFGTPLQEYWIDEHRSQLNHVSAILPLGAVMDYFTGTYSRCPQWVGDWGFEWLWRFCLEPRRMFSRYILGNPWFIVRMVQAAFVQTFSQKARKLLPAR